MKKILIIIFFSSFCFCHSQTKGKITYKITSIKDSIELPFENPKNTEVQNDVLQMIHNAQPVEAYLVFNDSIALYNVEPNTELPMWNNDDGNISVERAKINLTWIFAGAESIYYTDWSRNWNISQKNVFGVTKRIKRDTISWVLLDETKMIKQYQCYKATAENTKIEVWYAPEIPILHGPQGLNGLPGLVLEVKNGKLFKTTVEKIDFKNEDYKYIEEPKDGPLMEWEEYKKLGKLMFSDG